MRNDTLRHPNTQGEWVLKGYWYPKLTVRPTHFHKPDSQPCERGRRRLVELWFRDHRLQRIEENDIRLCSLQAVNFVGLVSFGSDPKNDPTLLIGFNCRLVAMTIQPASLKDPPENLFEARVVAKHPLLGHFPFGFIDVPACVKTACPIVPAARPRAPRSPSVHFGSHPDHEVYAADRTSDQRHGEHHLAGVGVDGEVVNLAESRDV